MNRPLKAALIGCGMIAGIHCLAMHSVGIEVRCIQYRHGSCIGFFQSISYSYVCFYG